MGVHFSPADLLQDLIAAFTLANTRPKGPRRTFEEDEEEQRRRNQRDDHNKRSKVREGVRNRGAEAFVNRVPPDVRERVIVDDGDRRAEELLDLAYEERCATVRLDPTKGALRRTEMWRREALNYLRGVRRPERYAFPEGVVTIVPIGLSIGAHTLHPGATPCLGSEHLHTVGWVNVLVCRLVQVGYERPKPRIRSDRATPGVVVAPAADLEDQAAVARDGIVVIHRWRELQHVKPGKGRRITIPHDYHDKHDAICCTIIADEIRAKVKRDCDELNSQPKRLKAQLPKHRKSPEPHGSRELVIAANALKRRLTAKESAALNRELIGKLRVRPAKAITLQSWIADEKARRGHVTPPLDADLPFVKRKDWRPLMKSPVEDELYFA